MERELDFTYLSEALDALDRLYDGDSHAKDVQVILKLVGLALGDRQLGQKIGDVAERLLTNIQSARPERLDDRAALEVTDEVRVAISEAWADLYPKTDPQ
jgi:hypothetical protein